MLPPPNNFVDFDDDNDLEAGVYHESHQELKAFNEDFRKQLEEGWARSRTSVPVHPAHAKADGAGKVMSRPTGMMEKRARTRSSPVNTGATEGLSSALPIVLDADSLPARPFLHPSQSDPPPYASTISPPSRFAPLRASTTICAPKNAVASSSKPPTRASPHKISSLSGAPPPPNAQTQIPPVPKEMTKIATAWTKYHRDQVKNPVRVVSRLMTGKTVCIAMAFGASNVLVTRWKQLQENSAILSLRYSPNVSHILVEPSLANSDLFKFVGVAGRNEIRPDVEVIYWEWYTRSKKFGLQPTAKYQYFPAAQAATPPAISMTTAIPAKRKSPTEGTNVPGISKRSKAQPRYDPTDSETSQSNRERPPQLRSGVLDVMPEEDGDDGMMTPPERTTLDEQEVGSELVEVLSKEKQDDAIGLDVQERWRIARAGEADGLDLMIDGVVNGSIGEGKDGELIELRGAGRQESYSPDRESADSVSSEGETTDEEPDLDNDKSARKQAGIAAARRARQPNAKADGPYKCQQDCAGKSTTTCVNEDLALEIEKLGKLYANSRDKNQFQKRAYVKTANKLRTLPYRITSREMALEVKGLGGGMADRIGEILKYGKTLREGYEDNEQSRAVAAFGKIYGVGPERANQLWDAGAKSLDDLRTKDFGLTSGQKLGLQYYDDLNTRIPRDEVAALFEIIKTEARKLDPKLMIDPMGSYRRGEATSGDLDILISREPSDGLSHAGVVHKLVDNLYSAGVLKHCVSEPRDWNSLEAKWMGTGKVRPGGLLRRIDILCIPHEQYGAASIYFTGNDHFNRSLRLYANKNGYSLNQRGLYKGVCRDPKTRLKTTEGTLVASATEQDIFDVLGIRYRPPNLRRP